MRVIKRGEGGTRMYSHFSTQTFLRASSSNKQSPADSKPDLVIVPDVRLPFDVAVEVKATPALAAGTISSRCFLIQAENVLVNSSVYVSSADVGVVALLEGVELMVVVVGMMLLFGLTAGVMLVTVGTDRELGVLVGPAGRFLNDCYDDRRPTTKDRTRRDETISPIRVESIRVRA